MIKQSGDPITRRNFTKDPSKLPLVVVLNNLRSLYNVGSIFRTSDAVGVEKIWLCGITGTPPDNQISKTALGAEKTVPWEYRHSALPLIKELKGKKYQIILLEQTENSIPYQEFQPDSPLCLVVGNEIKGVCDEILPYCDISIEIEMAGIKNSLAKLSCNCNI